MDHSPNPYYLVEDGLVDRNLEADGPGVGSPVDSGVSYPCHSLADCSTLP
jgi:hypothetical protein